MYRCKISKWRLETKCIDKLIKSILIIIYKEHKEDIGKASYVPNISSTTSYSPQITSIYTTLLISGIFLDAWKIANVIPILTH